MTRDAEHTPFPQSVVVPVEPDARLLSVVSAMVRRIAVPCGDEVYFDHGHARQLYKAITDSAPAPSSLAGGEVSRAVDHLTKRLNKPGAFHLSDQTSIRAILAALSPEAPARDAEAAHWLTDLLGDDQNGGFIRDLCYTVWLAGRQGYNGGPGDWANDTLPTVQRGVEMVRAKVEGLLVLTPRHEAPAEGAGDGMDAYTRHDTVEALRARSSAPEAREGGAWGWAVTWIEQGFGQQSEVLMGADHEKFARERAENEAGRPGNSNVMAFPLYTHPAAPSADKLRIVKSALELIAEGLPDARANHRLSEAMSISRQALVTLKAEGA